MEEKKNVQKPDELNDAQLERTSGGADRAEIQPSATRCPKCGRSSGIAVMAVFQCPYCGYQEAYVM